VTFFTSKGLYRYFTEGFNKVPVKNNNKQSFEENLGFKQTTEAARQPRQNPILGPLIAEKEAARSVFHSECLCGGSLPGDVVVDTGSSECGMSEHAPRCTRSTPGIAGGSIGAGLCWRCPIKFGSGVVSELGYGR
jgi:hypothetical protein